MVLLGGRAAEEVIFNEITTGAKDDLSKATEIAQEMVCSYGMSSLGNIAIKEQYIKYNIDKIEKEIKMIIDDCYKRTIKLIKENKIILIDIANYLLEYETIENNELENIISKYETPIKSAT